MKTEKPIGINEQIAVHLGFKKYKYTKDFIGNQVYQWSYPNDWNQPSIPCCSIPNFLEMINIVKELSPKIRKTGAPSFDNL